MKRICVGLKLKSGLWQLTKLDVKTDDDGKPYPILNISAPVYNEGRMCYAAFWKNTKKGRLLFKEIVEEEIYDEAS